MPVSRSIKIVNQEFLIPPITQSGEKVNRKVYGMLKSKNAANPRSLVSYAVVKTEA